MLDDAVAELEKAAQLSGDSPTVIADLARAYAASGKRGETIKLLGDLKKRSNSIYLRGSEIAVIYAALGDTDQAINWIQKVTKSALTLGFSCSRASILSVQIRFKDLVRRIGLPR
jgi:tetratricopeptide (TPR) repeat protein